VYEEVGSTVSVFDRAYDDPVRVLDEGGEVVGDVPDLDDEALVEMYRDMRLARHFDGRAVSLQRQGRMGTYPPLSGQEGAQIGSGDRARRGRLDGPLVPRARRGARSWTPAETDPTLLDGPRGGQRDARGRERVPGRGPHRLAGPARHRCGVGVEAPRRERRVPLLLRGRRDQRGRLPRGGQLRGRVRYADRLLLL